MIIERLDRLSYYQAVLPHIANALQALKDHQDNFEVNMRYPFEGGFLFFQEGITKPLSEGQFESHRRYIDVQVVLKGEEYVALEDRKNVEVVLPYSEDKDVEKYEGKTDHSMKISADMVYVCFPWDVHKAIFHINEELSFTKAVIKVEIN